MRLTTLFLLASLLPCAAACSKSTEIPSINARFDHAWGSRGSGAGQFSYPRAAAEDGHQGLYVIDKSGRVQHFDAQGNLLGGWALDYVEKGTPTGMCVAPDGLVYIADTHNHRILKYRPDGSLLLAFGSFGSAPGQMIYPTDIAVGPDEVLFVTEYGERDRLMRFDSEGRFLSESGDFGDGPGEFQRPMAVALSRQIEILVADSCNHRIQRFDLAGGWLGTFGEMGDGLGQLRYPYDLSVAPDGSLFVCEYGNNRVQKFFADGQPAGILGGAGSAEGHFACPWGLTVLGDEWLFVADTENHRLQAFRL